MPSVLKPGRNCWRIAKASRFALLVDGSAYYEAVAEAIEQADRTVFIVGWDLDSRVRLGPAGGPGELVPPLREFLPAVAAKNPELNIYMLCWDFPVIFANVRDPEFVWGRNPFKHPRVHLQFDSTHPQGASHHQKIVLIDDSLAFAGGMDIAGGRWDSPEHRPNDMRRAGKDGPYPPSHDIQAMVDGDAARALAEIVHDRWYRATGTPLAASDQTRDIWPDRLTPDFVDVDVAISRTDIDEGGNGSLEIEQLHLDLIAAARDHVYIENQYLTNATIVTAICRRLEEVSGPEVVMVLPLNNTGWLEELTIEGLRSRSIRQLRAADHFKRLRICYPVIADRDDTSVGVHSKILVVDDRIFRVGSSNLTNRSMRLDTECDLTIEAASAAQQSGISRLRNQLLAEHLGVSAGAVDAALAKDASLVRLVDSRNTQPRSLRQLPADNGAPELLDEALVDPSRPLTADFVIEALTSSVAPGSTKRVFPFVLVSVAFVFCFSFFVFRPRLFHRPARATSPPPTR